jgi:hypothetical protein
MPQNFSRLPPQLERIWFFGVKSCYFTRNTQNFSRHPPLVAIFLNAPPPPNLKSWIRPCVCILKPYILLILWTKTCIYSLESKVSGYYNNNIVLNNVFSIILLTFSAWKVMKLLLVWPVVPEISNTRHYKSFHSLNLQFLNYKISTFWLWAYQRKIIPETCHAH